MQSRRWESGKFGRNPGKDGGNLGKQVWVRDLCYYFLAVNEMVSNRTFQARFPSFSSSTSAVAHRQMPCPIRRRSGHIAVCLGV